MPRLPSSSADLYRSRSPVSVATSDTTYHSFYDIELFEPASPVATIRKVPHEEYGTPKPITRHDSGYESTYSGSSYGHNSKIRRTSQTGHQRRPSTQHASKSMPVSYPRRHSGHSLYKTMPQQQQQQQQQQQSQPQLHQQPNSYYYFPSPEIAGQDEATEETDQVYHPPPPQTTHYWMSDHTRRLEYAAIDAASRGIKGWVMKHVVPDCFVSKDNRRLTFDDDTGSVRRYRLELECDDSSIKEAKRSRKLGWLFGR